MPTYENQNTDVIHFVPHGAYRTACRHLDSVRTSWNVNNYDPVGVPADVTCCKCRETGVFLDDAERFREAAEGKAG